MPVDDAPERDAVPATNDGVGNPANAVGKERSVVGMPEDKEVPVADTDPTPDSHTVPITQERLPSPDLPPSFSGMPPPHFPPASQVPDVNVLQATPHASQEEDVSATNAPATLLEIPTPVPECGLLPSKARSKSRSRSRSPAVDTFTLRRSPRLASPGPSTKRGAPDDLPEPVAKKPREQ
jgi:hypothetical protein